MPKEHRKDETNNDQIKKSNPGDHDVNENEEARKDLNEHTRENEDKDSVKE